MTTLTLGDIQKAIDLVYPPLYYGLDKNTKRGTLYHCKETDYSPEYIVCHPDDFEDVKSKITARRLVHVKDEPKDKVIERILRKMKMQSVEIFTTSGA